MASLGSLTPLTPLTSLTSLVSLAKETKGAKRVAEVQGMDHKQGKGTEINGQKKAGGGKVHGFSAFEAENQNRRGGVEEMEDQKKTGGHGSRGPRSR